MKPWIILLAVVLLLCIVFFSATPTGRSMWNNWFHSVQKADDVTSYETKKQVEDTCRAMIVSYEADQLTYLQYHDSESAEQRGWADQAKMRANKTAAAYNEYILKNTYVWQDNIPKDIQNRLDYID